MKVNNKTNNLLTKDEMSELYYCYSTKKTARMVRTFKHFNDNFFVVWHEGDDPSNTYIFSEAKFQRRYSKQTRDKKGRFSSNI